MYGAIIGDVCGSTYEFNNCQRKDLDLFPRRSTFTDDTVMTVAVGKALKDTQGQEDLEIYQSLVSSIQYYGMVYPNRGYGTMFQRWLESKEPKPYGSYGNGSAMRVASIPYVAQTFEEALHLAELSASPTHNHPEGIRGAQAIAGAAYLANIGRNKTAIRRFIQRQMHYNIDFGCEPFRVRPAVFDETCQVTVPMAVVAFLEGEDFEDCIRNAISIGGDSDTIAAMTGTIAEHYYPIPDYMKDKIKELLPEPLLSQVERITRA